MTAKTYFQQIALAEAALKTLQARIRHYEDIGLSIASHASAAPGCHAGVSRVELAAVGMVDATAALQAKIDAYLQQIRQAEVIIDQIPQQKYRQILTLYYLCGWTLKSISDEIGYNDPNSIYRAHGWALAEAQRILDKRT